MNIISIGFNSEQFKCDGKDDSSSIQSAFDKLESGDILNFSKGTYEIDEPVNFPKDMFLMTGDVDSLGNPLSKIRLKNECEWTNKSLSKSSMFVGSASKNVEICNLEFDLNSGDFVNGKYQGNQQYIIDNYKYLYPWGHSFHNCFYFIRGSNIKVHDCYLHHALGDGYRAIYGANHYFYNNKVSLMGHEAAFFDGNPSQITNCYAYGNDITIRADSAIRADDAKNIEIHDNKITCLGNGNPGILIGNLNKDSNTDNISIFNNGISNTPGPGVWLYGKYTSKKNVKIHDNKISNCGTHTAIHYNSGMYISGFPGASIYNNRIDACYNAGILIDSTSDDVSITENTISGTKKTLAKGECYHGEWTGKALVNNSKFDITVKNNSFSNNSSGNYYGSYTNEDSVPCLVYVIGSKKKLLALSISQEYKLFKRES